MYVSCNAFCLKLVNIFPLDFQKSDFSSFFSGHMRVLRRPSLAYWLRLLYVQSYSPNSQSMTTDKTSQNWGITGDTGLTLSLREREPVIVTECREDIDKTNTATLIIVRCGTIQPVRSQHHIQSVTTSVADPSLGYGGTGTTNGVFRGQTSANLTQGGNQHHSTTMVGLHWCSKYNLLGDTT